MTYRYSNIHVMFCASRESIFVVIENEEEGGIRILMLGNLSKKNQDSINCGNPLVHCGVKPKRLLKIM